MTKKDCPVCKIVGIFVIIGALNSGIVGLLNTNYLDRILSHIHLARVVDALTCLAALVLLVSFFKACPACKK